MMLTYIAKLLIISNKSLNSMGFHVKDENETFFISVWKSLSSTRPLKGKLERKS